MIYADITSITHNTNNKQPVDFELLFRKQDGTFTTTHVHIIYDSVYVMKHDLRTWLGNM